MHDLAYNIIFFKLKQKNKKKGKKEVQRQNSFKWRKNKIKQDCFKNKLK